MKIDIYMSCPVCLQDRITYAAEYWHHAGTCGGRLCVDEHGMCECRRCSRRARIMDMKFRCPQGRHTFTTVGSVNAMAEALSTAGMIIDASGKAWIIQLMKNL